MIVLGMLVATAAVQAPVHELDPTPALREIVDARLAHEQSSIWSAWAASPRAALDFPRVRNPEASWLGPVRTSGAQIAASETSPAEGLLAE